MYINPTWIFNIWGPVWDAWLTWRKIIVDTYGWIWRHWGWAFSWKDVTKVDRSWAYMARFLAKNIVISWLSEKCEVQLSYAIWVPEPVSVYIDLLGTQNKNIKRNIQKDIVKIIKENIDLSPKWIIDRFELTKPIFSKLSTWWHFWKEWFNWEKSDNKIIEQFKTLLK